MSDNIDFVDRHEAKIRSITMEAPEGYEFGHIVKAEVELRVGKLEYTTDKEGSMVRTAVLQIESAHIKESLDPAQAYAAAAPVSDPVTDPGTDDSDASSNTVTTPDGVEVDVATGEVPLSEANSEANLVGAGVGAGDDDIDVGF